MASKFKPVAAIIDNRNGTFTVLKCDGDAARGKQSTVDHRPILGRRKVYSHGEAIRQADRIEWKYW